MTWLRRILVLLLLSVVACEAVFAVAWGRTPPADDVQARAAAYARAHDAAMLAPAQVPQLLAEAVIATEDERFYSHHGLDSIGIARAVLYDLRAWCACQGGSTLTQQLAKLLYLGGSDAGFRKLEGMALALKIEQHISKPVILADYLSVVPTGPTRNGMAGAACAYFGRPLADLDLASWALLAGLPQAPSSYDPLLHPQAAIARRLEVLAAMRSEGYISAAQLQAAAGAGYNVSSRPRCAS